MSEQLKVSVPGSTPLATTLRAFDDTIFEH
jgi:hypothetical protein